MTSSPVEFYLSAATAETTRRTMAESLDVVAGFFQAGAKRDGIDWASLRYVDSVRLRAWLVRRYKARTVNKHLSAYRGVLQACWRLQLLSTEDYHHARDVPNMKSQGPPAGRRLSIAELRQLVTSAARFSRRDAALLALMYAAGLRSFEVTLLRVGDYDPATRQVLVRGKRNKYRTVTVHEGWTPPITAWLTERVGRGNDPLFPGRDGKPMTRRMVGYIVSVHGRREKLPHFTSHDMRRTFLTDLIEAGADLVVVKRIAGHENIETTASYDRRDRKAEDRAIERLQPLEGSGDGGKSSGGSDTTQ